jgi:putative ABC transport system permease protein
VYLPESQWLWADNALTIVVRTRGAPEALVPAVRSAIWSVDRDQPIVRIARMDRLVAATAAQRRFIMVLFEAFAAVALVLAAAGIYGVLSGSVTERFREIGVRSALGASRAQIVGMILRQGIVLTAIGVGVGLAAAVGLTGVLRTLLFDVSRLDVVTFATVTAGLFVVALAACLLPAWRAARVDPMETLRAE